jgi:hypothetical protein
VKLFADERSAMDGMDAEMMNKRKIERQDGEHVASKLTVRVAKQLELDHRAATQKFGIIGRSESGKTYLAGRLVEGLHGIGCQVVIFDPVGVWWGLTLAANGKDAGLPFLVFGGRRGQLPLTADSGRRVAQLVVERNLSVVLDLTDLRKRRRGGKGGETESELQRFMADFQEEALAVSQKHPKPRLALYDEAQMILPQVVNSGGERMLGTGEDLIRTGRNSGWGFVLMSQRPQSIHKEVLSQVECFFVGQLTEPHARNRLKEWIVEKKADVRTELDDLVQLERGEFFVWSPQWLRVFKKIRVLPKWTYDSSRTPELGSMLLPGAPRQSSISASELESLRDALLAESETAVSSGTDNTEQIRRERELRLAAERRAERAERAARALREGLSELQRRVGELVGRARLPEDDGLSGDEKPGHKRPASGTEVPAEGLSRGRRSKRPSESRQTERRVKGDSGTSVPRSPSSGSSAASGLDKCQRAILTVLVQQDEPLSQARLARLTGYPAKTSSIKNALSKLRGANRIEGRGDAIAVTELGRQAIGAVPPLPKGRGLFDYWLRDRRLDKCTRAILIALRDARRAVGTKTELADLTGYPRDTSSVKNGLSKLRTLGLIQGRGQVELVGELRSDGE